MEQKTPQWLKLSDELGWSLIGMGLASLNPDSTNLSNNDLALAMVPYLSLLHFAHSLEASIIANKAGRHSVAICLVRQCVETLTLVDIGLQDASYSQVLLEGWSSGKKTHGDLRKSLENNIWPNYGTGLWNENWSAYFGNLARAVQPYAHYTYQLQGWQHAVVKTYYEQQQYISLVGLQTYDPIKASRITLFHSLLAWTLGRLLLAFGKNADVNKREKKIRRLGKLLGKSKLLFSYEADWGTQLLPDMMFKSDMGWHDN